MLLLVFFKIYYWTLSFHKSIVKWRLMILYKLFINHNMLLWLELAGSFWSNLRESSTSDISSIFRVLLTVTQYVVRLFSLLYLISWMSFLMNWFIKFNISKWLYCVISSKINALLLILSLWFRLIGLRFRYFQPLRMSIYLTECLIELILFLA